MRTVQVDELIFPTLTLQVSCDDEVQVLEEVLDVQMPVRHKRAPAKVWAAVTLAARVEHRSRRSCGFVPAAVIV